MRSGAVLLFVAHSACGQCGRDDSGVRPLASAEAIVTPTSKSNASCDRVTTMSVCSEYGGALLAREGAVLGSSCARLGGTYALDVCPNTTLVGACRLATGEARRFYSSGGRAYDPSSAQTECEGVYRGVWSR